MEFRATREISTEEPPISQVAIVASRTWAGLTQTAALLIWKCRCRGTLGSAGSLPHALTANGIKAGLIKEDKARCHRRQTAAAESE